MSCRQLTRGPCLPSPLSVYFPTCKIQVSKGGILRLGQQLQDPSVCVCVLAVFDATRVETEPKHIIVMLRLGDEEAIGAGLHLDTSKCAHDTR